MSENSKTYENVAPIRDVCLIILAAVAITAALVYTKAVLVPFTFALFIFAISSPVVNWFQTRLKLPRSLAIVSVAAVFLMISTLILVFVVNSIGSFVAGASQYREQLVLLLDTISKNAEKFGYEIEAMNYRDRIQTLPLFAYAQNVTGVILGIIGQSTLVIIFVLFMLFGKKEAASTPRLVDEIFTSVSKYLSTKLFTSITTGILVWIVLAAFDVDLAFMFAVLTVLLNFIPSIGSVIATFVPMPIVILQFGFGPSLFIIFLLIGGIQFTIGNLIEPKLLGEKLDLHPVAVLVFLIFWGIVWGIPGMFIAVPITAIIKIVLYRIPHTRDFSELLSGRFNF